MEDIEKKFLEIANKEYLKIAKRLAVKAEPKYSVKEIYADKSLAKLKELAKINKISGYTKKTKDELVELNSEAVLDVKRAGIIIKGVSMIELNCMLDVMSSDLYECDGIECNNLDMFFNFGFVQLYNYDDKILAVVPNELKPIIKNICTRDFINDKAKVELTLSYILAASNLYGIIEIDELVEIYNSQNNQSITKAELIECANNRSDIEELFYLHNDFIVSAGVEKEVIPYLLAEIKGKTRFIPEKEELLCYEMSDYYEDTEYTDDLQAFFENELGDIELALEYTEKVVMMSSSGIIPSDIIKMLINELDEEFDVSKSQVMMSMIVGVYNNTRMWQNKGYTPSELSLVQYSKSGTTPRLVNTSTTQPKIGRNEPCSCGSGKKYKKCCGR